MSGRDKDLSEKPAQLYREREKAVNLTDSAKEVELCLLARQVEALLEEG